MRDILQTALESLGYVTYIADDGDVALELYREYHPGLVVSDIYMPRFDGLRLMREIKDDNVNTPVILITGYSHFEQAQTQGDIKPDALLRKPFNLRELLETIREVKPEHA
jgi:OmpR family response regulator RpaB